MKSIGKIFAAELTASGIPLDGISWSSDGNIFYRNDVPPSIRSDVATVLAAHNPSVPPPKPKREIIKEKLLARDPKAIADPIISELVEFAQEIL